MNALLICDDSNLSDIASLCSKFGFGIEVQGFYDPQVNELKPHWVGEVKEIIQGITPVSLHGCFGDLCPGSFDALVRQVTRQRFEESYHIANTLGARHLILHHGYVPHTSPVPGWIKRSTEFWQEFLAGKNADFQIHMENYLDLGPDLIAEVVHTINRPNLDVNLDIGHAHAFSNVPVVKWIEQLGQLIGYVHLHDNHGQEDEHLGLGQGTIPLKEVCQALNDCAPEAIWALEAQGGGIQQSIDWLGAHGFLVSS